MIKFFRHIRQRTVASNGINEMIKDPPESTHSREAGNRVSKYLLYAIGEVILVVIGILIALQINNWNESRKSQLQEQALLMQLQSEFISNQAQLEEKMEIRNGIIKSSSTLLEYIDNPVDIHPDSILKHIAQTLLTPTFDPIVNDLISSGRIQLLQSGILKERLSLWTSEIVQVTEEEHVLKDFVNATYLAFVTENYSMRNLLNAYWTNNTGAIYQLDKGKNTQMDLRNSKQTINQMSLLTNIQFEDHLAYIATMAKIANGQSTSLNNRISEILQLIDQEIE